MPETTLLDISQPVQELMLSELRRARYGYLLALHILLLCAAGRTPTEIAAFLFCSRSSVYRTLKAYLDGSLGFEIEENGELSPPSRTSFLSPSLKRSLLCLLKATPRAYGWCRTRWSCASLSAQLKANRGIEVSADTLRRWLHSRHSPVCLEKAGRNIFTIQLDTSPPRRRSAASICHHQPLVSLQLLCSM